MTAVFDSQPGRLVRLRIDNPESFLLAVDGVGELPGIITGLKTSSEVSAQVLTSLANTVHVTAFGDKPSTIAVQLLLNDPCSVTAGSTMRNYLDYYAKNRLTAPSQGGSLVPVVIVIGATSWQGFLLRADLALIGEGAQMTTGDLSFVAWRLS